MNVDDRQLERGRPVSIQGVEIRLQISQHRRCIFGILARREH